MDVLDIFVQKLIGVVMYKNLQIIFLIFLAVIIFSCSQVSNHTVKEVDGVKYYYNKHQPSKTITLNPVKLFEIDGTSSSMADSVQSFVTISKIVSDFNNNIYILDQEKGLIKKYSNNGQYDKLIGVQGKEVGQLYKPSEMVLMYDTLVVYDTSPNRYLRYITNGRYLSSQLLMGTNTPQYLTSDGKTNLASFQFVKYKRDTTKYMNNDICLLSDRFKVIKVIKEIKYSPDSPDFFIPDMFTTYFQKDGMFYIANNESDKYSIDVINSRGNLKYIIEKEYEKLPYNSYEIGQVNIFIGQLGGSALDATKTYHKKAVNMVYVDKYDRIWALPSVLRTKENESTHFVDIFENGVFLNRVILDFVGKNETFQLSGDRLYVINNMDKKIRVYEY